MFEFFNDFVHDKDTFVITVFVIGVPLIVLLGLYWLSKLADNHTDKRITSLEKDIKSLKVETIES